MRSTSDEILERLKLAGHKFTGKRKEIVSLFVQHQNQCFTAKDVFTKVKHIFPKISFDTVYRTLTLLEENGVIESLEFGANAARYRLVCRDQHHHHFICMICGCTSVLDNCPVRFVEDEMTDFTIVDHRFELYGYCKCCQP